MELSEQKQYYEEASGTVSDITRGLNYSLIAIVWILCGNCFENLSQFRLILVFIILSLLVDFLQYLWRTIACFVCFRCNEQKLQKRKNAVAAGEQAPEVDDFPIAITVTTWTLFGLKIMAMVIAAILVIIQILGNS